MIADHFCVLERSSANAVHDRGCKLKEIEEMKCSSKRKYPKLCLISSSGGHYEQLRMLASLTEAYEVFG